MKLYGTVTSERATKGQGGNKRLDILVSDSERFEVARLYFQVSEDGRTAKLSYWDRTMAGDGFTSEIILEKTKGEKKKGEFYRLTSCANCKQRIETYTKTHNEPLVCPSCGMEQ